MRLSISASSSFVLLLASLLACDKHLEVLTVPDPTAEAGAPDASTLPADAAPGDASAPPIVDDGAAARACHWVETSLSKPACTNGCLVRYPQGGAPQVLADDGNEPYSLNYGVAANDAWVFVTTFQSLAEAPGTRRLLAFPAAGGPPRVVDEFRRDAANALVRAPLFAGGHLYYRYEEQVTLGAPRVSSLRRWDLSAPPGVRAQAVATLPEADVSGELVVDGGYVYYSHAGGIGRAPESGGPTASVARAGKIHTFAVSGGAVFWSAGLPYSDTTGSIHRLSLAPGSAPETLLTSTPSAITIDAATSTLLAISGRELVEMNLDGSGARTLVTGDPLPQHPGTLLPTRIEASGSRVFFEQACDFDPDLPTYGVRVLDRVARTARWLDADPSFPHVAGLARPSGLASSTLANTGNLYRLVVGP